jgi:hypothetical protein
MKLFSVLFNVKIQGDIFFSKIFHFISWGDDVVIKLIENYDFPSIVILSEYLFQKLFLNGN